VSWGKIRIDAKPVKVSCDATIIFPLIVSQTFYKAYQQEIDQKKVDATA
jgi:deoxyhypusine synthase